MPFKFELTETPERREFLLHGRVDSATAPELDRALTGIAENPQQSAILDFAALDYISSAGLRVILLAAKRARETRQRLVLCSLAPTVREVFEVSGFGRILEITSDLESARKLVS